MKQRPRIYYSDTQKALMWERWKQGWTLHEIGKLFDRAHSSIHRILAETGGFRPPERSRAAIALTLAEREDISRAMVSANRFAPLQLGSGEHRRRSAERSSAMAAAMATVQRRPMKQPGVERGAQSAASSGRTVHWPESWLTSCDCCGRRSKLQVGSSKLILATRATKCHTRPSTAVCSSKRVAP